MAGPAMCCGRAAKRGVSNCQSHVARVSNISRLFRLGQWCALARPMTDIGQIGNVRNVGSLVESLSTVYSRGKGGFSTDVFTAASHVHDSVTHLELIEQPASYPVHSYYSSVLTDNQPQLLALLSLKDAPSQHIGVKLVARVVAVDEGNNLFSGHTSTLCCSHCSLLLLSPMVDVKRFFSITWKSVSIERALCSPTFIFQMKELTCVRKPQTYSSKHHNRVACC